MALSVLSIDTNKGVFGLYDSITEKFIMTGKSHEMYKLKHEIEEAEQQDDNKIYFQELMKKYKKMYGSIKQIGNKKSNTSKSIELFQKYLESK